MYSKVLLAGRVARDIELKDINGTSFVELVVAVQHTWKSKGELKKSVSFVDTAVWGRNAELCSQYLEKGSKVLVDGHLQQDRWISDDGRKRYRLKVLVDWIQFLDDKKDNSTTGDFEEEEDVPF